MIGKDEEIHNFTFPLLFAGHGGGSTTGTNYQVDYDVDDWGNVQICDVIGVFLSSKTA